MLTYFIESLAAVIAFAIFEYTHNRATYSIKTAWVKYIAGVILGTFGFPYLLKWSVFQYVLQATFVVAFLFFFWVIVQKLKIKGIPGQPLKAVVLILVIAGFASCSHQGKITFTEIDTLHTLRDVPVFDAAGNRLPYNAPRKDTIYSYEPSGAWKAKYAWHRGDIALAIAGAVVLLGYFFGYYVPRNNNNGNKKEAGTSSVVLLIVLIIGAGLIIGGTLDWALSNTTQLIDKPVYDKVSQSPGGLDSLMEARLKH